MGFNPGRLLGQRAHDGAVETAWRAIVDVFDASWSLQARLAEPALQRPVLSPVPLPIDEQAEPFFKAELVDVGLLHLLLQGLGHAAHAHGAEFVDCRLVQHDESSVSGGLGGGGSKYFGPRILGWSSGGRGGWASASGRVSRLHFSMDSTFL